MRAFIGPRHGYTTSWLDRFLLFAEIRPCAYKIFALRCNLQGDKIQRPKINPRDVKNTNLGPFQKPNCAISSWVQIRAVRVKCNKGHLWVCIQVCQQAVVVSFREQALLRGVHQTTCGQLTSARVERSSASAIYVCNCLFATRSVVLKPACWWRAFWVT